MITEYRILIFSENPDKLFPFYKNVLEFELERKIDIPHDYGYMFKVNDNLRLWIGKHPKVVGKNKEPLRHMFNLYVESVSTWFNKIKNNPDVTIICTPKESPLSTKEQPKYVATFLDPEGNCWQFAGLQ
jgi:uncharacterized glyoxalase superfamily protein PhnB